MTDSIMEYLKKNSKYLKVIHRDNVGSLRVYRMPKGQRAGVGYKYLVTAFGGTSHTAFHTKKGFDDYIKTYGLKVGKQETGFGGKGSGHKIYGVEKNEVYAGTQKQLDALAKRNHWKPTKVMDNGRYVRGYIKKTKRGNVVVYMNPNYKPRELKYIRP